MAITSLDGLIAAPTQKLTYLKTATRTTIAATPYSAFDLGGNPAAGTLAIGNTTTGVVPTDAVNGYPTISAFVGGNTGYLAGVQFGSSVASRITIMDCLFSVGAIAFTSATTTLSSQPSYASRVLTGTDQIIGYCDLENASGTATVSSTNSTFQVNTTSGLFDI